MSQQAAALCTLTLKRIPHCPPLLFFHSSSRFISPGPATPFLRITNGSSPTFLSHFPERQRHSRHRCATTQDTTGEYPTPDPQRPAVSQKKGGCCLLYLPNLIVHFHKHHLHSHAVSPATTLCPLAVNATRLQLPNEREHLFMQAHSCLEGAE